jgi:hypothetical protein
MAIKASLTSGVARRAGPATEQAPASPPAEDAEPRRSARPTAPQKSRTGRVSIGFWASRETRKALHRLALDEDTTVELLLHEAIDDLFQKRGKPRIAAEDG